MPVSLSLCNIVPSCGTLPTSDEKAVTYNLVRETIVAVYSCAQTNSIIRGNDRKTCDGGAWTGGRIDICGK